MSIRMRVKEDIPFGKSKDNRVTFVGSMGKYAGKVIDVYDWHGLYVDREPDGNWCWHPDWLEPVTEIPVKECRKHYPVATGVLAYFPLSMKALAHCSYVGNEQHNKGEPLHWDRSKSTDEDDAMIRHYLDSLGPNKVDSDGVLHSTKVCWRALARLEKELEAEESK